MYFFSQFVRPICLGLTHQIFMYHAVSQKFNQCDEMNTLVFLTCSLIVSLVPWFYQFPQDDKLIYASHLVPIFLKFPIFLRSLNRLIHTICFIFTFIFNLIFQFFSKLFFLHFLIGYVATTVQFQILTIIPLIMDLRCTHCLHLLTLLKSNPNL